MDNIMDESLAEQRWNAEYRNGRYTDEPPIPFVDEIIAQVTASPIAANGLGLYIGCGNGRNYLPLVDADLVLSGIDLSQEAINQLIARRPSAAHSLFCGDFRHLSTTSTFSYIIAIQVFQHATEADVDIYFAKVADLLKPGGLFCLRVNSISTQIYHKHKIIKQNQHGGMTIQYDEGPKQGMSIHFYSWEELNRLTEEHFFLISQPREVVIMRSPPKVGSWVQWEAIWKKK